MKKFLISVTIAIKNIDIYMSTDTTYSSVWT